MTLLIVFLDEVLDSSEEEETDGNYTTQFDLKKLYLV